MTYNPDTPQFQDAEEMVNDILSYAPNWFDTSFVDSVQCQMVNDRFISEKQFLAITRTSNMLREKGVLR